MILALILLAQTIDLDTTVHVSGEGFRVDTKGPQVRVVPKRSFKEVTLERRDNMRVAVKRVTGCEIEDEFFTGAANGYMVGRLKCAPSR